MTRVSVSELFKTATSLDHLRHPNSSLKVDGKISLSKRILGISLFALSGLATLGVIYAFYLITACKKISQNPQSPSVQKTQKKSKIFFDQKKAEVATPLFHAVDKGNLEELKQLLSIKKLGVNSFNNEGFPLLIYAIRKNEPNIIDFLLEQPDLNINISRYNLGFDVKYNALHEAAVQGHDKIISQLLKKGIDPNIIDADGRAPIHHAIHHGHLEVVKALIADPRSDIHIKDTQEGGYSPLLFAVERKKEDITKELINSQKELHFEDKDFYKNNIFHLLFNGGHTVLTSKGGVDLFKIVLNACPELSKKKLLLEKDQNEKTPYELGTEALKQYLEEREEGLSDKQKTKYDEIFLLVEKLKP